MQKVKTLTATVRLPDGKSKTSSPLTVRNQKEVDIVIDRNFNNATSRPMVKFFGKSYYDVGNINLLEVFMRQEGRRPAEDEVINVIVENDVYISDNGKKITYLRADNTANDATYGIPLIKVSDGSDYHSRPPNDDRRIHRNLRQGQHGKYIDIPTKYPQDDNSEVIGENIHYSTNTAPILRTLNYNSLSADGLRLLRMYTSSGVKIPAGVIGRVWLAFHINGAEFELRHNYTKKLMLRNPHGYHRPRIENGFTITRKKNDQVIETIDVSPMEADRGKVFLRPITINDSTGSHDWDQNWILYTYFDAVEDEYWDITIRDIQNSTNSYWDHKPSVGVYTMDHSNSGAIDLRWLPRTASVNLTINGIVVGGNVFESFNGVEIPHASNGIYSGKLKSLNIDGSGILVGAGGKTNLAITFGDSGIYLAPPNIGSYEPNNSLRLSTYIPPTYDTPKHVTGELSGVLAGPSLGGNEIFFLNNKSIYNVNGDQLHWLNRNGMNWYDSAEHFKFGGFSTMGMDPKYGSDIRVFGNSIELSSVYRYNPFTRVMAIDSSLGSIGLNSPGTTVHSYRHVNRDTEIYIAAIFIFKVNDADISDIEFELTHWSDKYNITPIANKIQTKSIEEFAYKVLPRATNQQLLVKTMLSSYRISLKPGQTHNPETDVLMVNLKRPVPNIPGRVARWAPTALKIL